MLSNEYAGNPGGKSTFCENAVLKIFERFIDSFDSIDYWLNWIAASVFHARRVMRDQLWQFCLCSHIKVFKHAWKAAIHTSLSLRSACTTLKVTLSSSLLALLRTKVFHPSLRDKGEQITIDLRAKVRIEVPTESLLAGWSRIDMAEVLARTMDTTNAWAGSITLGAEDWHFYDVFIHFSVPCPDAGAHERIEKNSDASRSSEFAEPPCCSLRN